MGVHDELTCQSSQDQTHLFSQQASDLQSGPLLVTASSLTQPLSHRCIAATRPSRPCRNSAHTIGRRIHSHAVKNKFRLNQGSFRCIALRALPLSGRVHFPVNTNTSLWVSQNEGSSLCNCSPKSCQVARAFVKHPLSSDVPSAANILELWMLNMSSLAPSSSSVPNGASQ